MDTSKLSGKSKRWIVVADESVAEIYEQAEKYSPVKKQFVIHNESARKKTSDIITDHGGRSFDSFGAGRHTMAKENHNPKAEKARAFAKLIASRIIAALNNGQIEQFGLVAAPKFLGTLRKALGGVHGAEPLFTIAKEITGQDAVVVDGLLAEL
jgi:protein required for attachment to host cells